MECSFQALPPVERTAIKQRFTADRRSFVAFMGANFEMQVHQLLLRQGASAEFRGSQEGPDIRFVDGEKHYGVECTVLHGTLLPNEEECVERFLMNPC